ncbi:MAG: transmembrane protein [Promethearchaeota archaeon CR_4]|nr:MAG: transmembrane protein [Candidatus Lokiarchaeota archaeon CR_4]
MPPLEPPPKRPPFVSATRDDNKSVGEIAAEEVQQLKAELAKKDQELTEMLDTFTELKKYVDQLESQKGNLTNQLETSKLQVDLKNNQLGAIQIKDSQIAMLNESLKLKDTQIQALNDSLTMKDQQMKTLQEAVRLKDDQINQIKLTSASSQEVGAIQVQLKDRQKILEEKNAQIEDLKKEIINIKKENNLLNQDLEAADKLSEELQKKLSDLSGSSGTLDLEKVRYTRDQIAAKFIDILNHTIHNVTIVTPSIEDLENLKLFEVKNSVSVKVACNIDGANQKHAELLAEFESLDNISIRQYDAKDRWGISRDNEELFLAAVGDSNLVFYSRDALHLKLLNPIIMESWLRSRKL